jgi:hypothetical protein
VGSTSIYLCLFHESLLINLVEILLFHRESLEAMSGDTLLELLDYCHRQIVYMNSGYVQATNPLNPHSMVLAGRERLA